MNNIQSVFKRPRVFLPVIHLPGGESGAFEAVGIAVRAGADGVFLINQGMGALGVVALIPKLREHFPGLWVGVNLLGHVVDQIVAHYGDRIDGIWSDNAGVDSLDEDISRAHAHAYTSARAKAGWKGLYFGGTAFKTQRDIPAKHLPTVAQRAAGFMEVVCTSGRGTGVAAEVSKVKTMREAIPGVPMALASGITPENVDPFLPYVEAYLVATGIEREFGVLDPDRTKTLADKIHGYGV